MVTKLDHLSISQIRIRWDKVANTTESPMNSYEVLLDTFEVLDYVQRIEETSLSSRAPGHRHKDTPKTDSRYKHIVRLEGGGGME